MAGPPKWPLVLGFGYQDSDYDGCVRLLEEIRQGIDLYPPELSEEGLGGTYWLRGRNGRCVAVCKPSTQEPYATDNPKRSSLINSSGRIVPHRRGFREGDGYLREIAAYTLDTGHFAGVPLTFLVSYQSNGMMIKASVQAWQDHDGSAEDFGSSMFPILAVQRIAVLDIRICNCDRHAGNLLISREEEPAQVIPIDHGYCLGSTLNEAFFEWLTWPQVREPILPEVRTFIESINVDEDVKLLHRLNFPSSSIRTFVACSYALKVGASLGLTLHQIGSFVSPVESTRTSALDRLVAGASIDEESQFMSSAESFLKTWLVSVL